MTSSKVLSSCLDKIEKGGVHRGIAYVPQGRIVVPEMSVRDNLMIGAHILGSDRAAIDAATERVLQLFSALRPRLKQQAAT